MSMPSTVSNRLGWWIAAVSLAVAALVSWNPALAQDGCLCDHVTVRVDPAIACDIEVCWTFSEEGAVFCDRIKPGGALSIPCPAWAIYISTCTGSYQVWPNLAKPCTPSLSVPGHCCIRACWTIGRDGCQVLQITPDPACPAVGC